MGKAQKKQEQELRAIKGKAKATVKAAKKATVAKGKRESGAKKPAQVVVVPTSSAADRPEPPFRYEIHVKKAQCIVEVTLHNVPPSTIDISKTTRRRLVVDCAAYTKKYLLEFDLPHNMTIDPEKADYTFESGVLKCILTSDTGAVPESAKKEREDFIVKVKDQKHLRFRTTKEGDLVVRSKLAGLKMAEEKKQKKADAAAAAAAPAPAKKEKKAEAPKAAKGKKAAAAEEAAAPSKYLSDGDVAALAASISNTTKSEIKGKVKALKDKQSKIENRDNARQNKKDARKEKQTGVFKRVVDEQKRKLAERIALSLPKQKDTSGRKVSFQ